MDDDTPETLEAKVAYFEQLRRVSRDVGDDEFDAAEAERRRLHRGLFAKRENTTDIPTKSTPPEATKPTNEPVHEAKAKMPPPPPISSSFRAATGKRKKISALETKLRPENEQIFKGLRFFYVPDDDVAPARRLRINKAKEFGAAWVRSVAGATHVIVDKGLEYKDVEKMLRRGEDGNDVKVKLVNENYPIDCIQFRAVLDPCQKKYLLVGQPAEESGGGGEMGETPLSPGDEDHSLRLKAPQRKKGKWDYVPQKETPSPQQGGSSEVLGAGGERNDGVFIVESKKGEAADEAPRRGAGPDAVSKGDELSEYISMMQEFKDLPLDPDDDAQSTTAGNTSTADLSDGRSEGDESCGSESEPTSEGSRFKRKRRTRASLSRKEITFEDRFACHRAGERNAGADNPNARTIEVLRSMNSYYERINDQWRTLAYRKAISTLQRQAVKISTEEEAFRLPSIGRRLAQKIEEIVTTDRLKRLEYAEDEPTGRSMEIFLGIYGVGNRQAEQWIAQGLRTLEDVKLRAKLTASQKVGVEHYEDLNTRIPRREVSALGEVVKTAAARIDPEMQLIIGGSYRRGAESSHDIDFLVTRSDADAQSLRVFLDKLVAKLEADAFLVAQLASSRRAGNDGSKWHGCCVLPRIRGLNNDDNYKPTWRRIDFLLVPGPEAGAALIYFTGNDIFNRSMRLLASKKGMRLNQRGLYRDVMRGRDRAKVTEGQLVEGRDERRIFEILGVKWREPHERWC